MSILSKSAIEAAIKRGDIEIEPSPVKIGPNSVDLHLGNEMKVYDLQKMKIVEVVKKEGEYLCVEAIDPHDPPSLIDVRKVEDGEYAGCWVLLPGVLYIASTMERTKCVGYTPCIDGRSTCGRLGISLHQTAGVGDNGFNGRWTLEITVVHPVVLRAGMRLAQIYFFECVDDVGALETDPLYLYDGHYQGAECAAAASPLDDR